METKHAPTRPSIAKPRLNAEQFTSLHREYENGLVNRMAGLVRDRARAEDIAATAYARAWEKRRTFRGNASPATWIEAIARNEARSFYSRDTPHRFVSIHGPDGHELAESERVIDALERRDDRQHLASALARLPEKQRRALTAHFVDGLSVREIAEREQVPIGTVLSRIHAGKERLRETWKTAVPAPGESESRSVAEMGERGRSR